MRKTANLDDTLIVVCNFTPEVHGAYRIGVPILGNYQEIFNSDWEKFGGSGQQNVGILTTETVRWQNQSCSLVLNIPPLATVYLKPLPSHKEERL